MSTRSSVMASDRASSSMSTGFLNRSSLTTGILDRAKARPPPKPIEGRRPPDMELEREPALEPDREERREPDMEDRREGGVSAKRRMDFSKSVELVRVHRG